MSTGLIVQIVQPVQYWGGRQSMNILKQHRWTKEKMHAHPAPAHTHVCVNAHKQLFRTNPVVTELVDSRITGGHWTGSPGLRFWWGIPSCSGLWPAGLWGCLALGQPEPSSLPYRPCK